MLRTLDDAGSWFTVAGDGDPAGPVWVEVVSRGGPHRAVGQQQQQQQQQRADLAWGPLPVAK